MTEITVQDIQDAYIRLVLKKRLKRRLPKLQMRLFKCSDSLWRFRLGLDPKLVKRINGRLAVQDN